jgi:hypothetical protein
MNAFEILEKQFGIKPIDPSIYTCEKCGERPASGTIGSLKKMVNNEPDRGEWVCIPCYRKIFPNSSIPD